VPLWFWAAPLGWQSLGDSAEADGSVSLRTMSVMSG
jgi:hypothetical protein